MCICIVQYICVSGRMTGCCVAVKNNSLSMLIFNVISVYFSTLCFMFSTTTSWFTKNKSIIIFIHHDFPFGQSERTSGFRMITQQPLQYVSCGVFLRTEYTIKKKNINVNSFLSLGIKPFE